MAARLERARGALAALEAALELEEEEGDVPTRVLVEHQMDTRRKQKLLLSQLRVLKLLLGVIENPGQPLAPSDLREAMAQARGHWQELKAKYGEALGALEEAVPAALEQLERGQQLLQRGKAALEARLEQQEELKVKVREATGRRDQLLRRVQERRLQRLRHQEELQGLRDRAARVKASCELYQTLAGAQVLPPSPGTPKQELELELGPPPGSSQSLPPLCLSLTPSGEVQLQEPPLGLPPPLGPGLLELQQRCWESWSLWEEVAHLRNRFALDWQPDLGLLQVLGGPQGAQTLWTLQVEPGYPKNGGVKLLPPMKGAPTIPAPPDPPTLTRWLELLVGGGPEKGDPPLSPPHKKTPLHPNKLTATPSPALSHPNKNPFLGICRSSFIVGRGLWGSGVLGCQGSPNRGVPTGAGRHRAAWAGCARGAAGSRRPWGRRGAPGAPRPTGTWTPSAWPSARAPAPQKWYPKIPLTPKSGVPKSH